MQINQKGLDLIKQFEGCRLKAYRDVVGIWTIGFGHTGDDVHPGMVITQDEADELLQSDLSDFEYGIEQLVQVQLNDNQFSALVSFTYNVGLGNFKGSKLLKKINKQDFEGAAQEFGRWANAGGRKLSDLVRRREAEKELFLS